MTEFTEADVEKAARALFSVMYPDAAWKNQPAHYRGDFRKRAKAVLSAVSPEASATPDEEAREREPEAICNKCKAPKGLQVVGESCNNNCGGKVIANPKASASRPSGGGPSREELREVLEAEISSHRMPVNAWAVADAVLALWTKEGEG